MTYSNVNLSIVDHPLVSSRLAILRAESTTASVFRATLAELATMLIYEATREMPTDVIDIRTPVAATQGTALSNAPLIVPVLRAGLGMADAAQKLLPESQMGFVGLARDEETHEPVSYMESLPHDLSNRSVLVLDPMLATGGSLVYCLEMLIKRNASSITVVCVLAAPEGLKRLDTMGTKLRVLTASVDERLDERAFIVPGLGDAGDRQFGSV